MVACVDSACTADWCTMFGFAVVPAFSVERLGAHRGGQFGRNHRTYPHSAQM